MKSEGEIFGCGALHAAFGAMAALYPDNIAVVDANGSVTYNELQQRSSRVAAAISARRNVEGKNVGIYLDRSIDMIAAIIGVLKAGASYVPLDPTFPAERLSYLAEDSELAVIVRRSDMQGRWVSPAAAELVDIGQSAAPGELPAAPAGEQAAPDRHSPAYMIYTSGSTGKPKGVVVSHHNVLRLMESTVPLFRFDQQDVWTMFHSVGFDFSVWEMWGALLTGGKLVIVPYETSRSSEDFYGLLRDTGTTILNITASAFRYLLPVYLEHGALPALRTVIFGGEKLDMAMLRPWVTAFGAERVELVNMYGITEATVHATYKRLSADDIMHRSDSPIGVPLADLRLHILDDDRRPVAPGQPGEMYIEGPGVALGYYKRPDLTSQRFIELAAPAGGKARVYRTGDLVVQGEDGELAYLRRADDQMKVRGFRIEPQEIEACLNKHPDVASSVVTVFDFGDGDERLVGYYVLRSGAPHDPAALVKQLRAAVAAELPAHMRPSEFVKIDALPINENGKLSRKLLVKPRSIMSASGKTRLDLLVGIHGIVTQVLNIDSVGDDDDFFEIGGTSLTLLRVLAKIKEQFDVKINLSLLANGATVSSLADAIRQQTKP